jgi:23S rRNA G2445 N2-methylase RlmL
MLGRMENLFEAIRSPGYTPKRAEAGVLFDLLGEKDKTRAAAADRALAQLGLWAAEQAMARFTKAEPPARGRLCRLVGRVAQRSPDEVLLQFLRGCLDDPDLKSRRSAVNALGKLRAPWIERVLLERWSRDTPIEERRALAEALGKTGGENALLAFRSFKTLDAELGRILIEAALKIERTIRRDQLSRIDPTRPPSGAIQVSLHCRIGLEKILQAEARSIGRARIADKGQVTVKLERPLQALYTARTMLRFGFPLPPRTRDGALDENELVARELSSESALSIFRTWTVGPIRYRIEWAGAGHRRAATWRLARCVSQRTPELINDPTQSTWEVVVATGEDRLQIEIWPRGLEDPRFVYRRKDVPAASHPTLAAAIARVAGVRTDDVVWDPFVGSGTELVERGLLGPFRRLYGSDLDPLALAAARENLSASGLANWELELADVRSYQPPELVTLVITNPPMGRRTLPRKEIKRLYTDALEHINKVLAPTGRFVWISPLFDQSIEIAKRAGFRPTYRQKVDMGGFSAELQAFVLNSSRRY